MIILNKTPFIFALITVLLGGCSGYKESFAKEPGRGSGWKSMSETYDFNEKSMENNLKTGKNAITSLPLNGVMEEVNMTSSQNLSTHAMTRLPEKTLRIWFAPFEDAQHNLYEASYVQTIVQNGQWKPFCQNGAA